MSFTNHPFRAVINRMTLDDYRRGGPVVTLPRSQYREIADDSTPPAAVKAQELAQ